MAVVTTLLVRWAGGWTEVEWPGASERREGFLSLGDVQSLDEVERVALGVLGRLHLPQEVVTATVEPTSSADQPYIAYRVGDYVTAADGTGSPSSQRVRGITTTEDVDGDPVFVPQLNDALLEAEERLLLAVKRLANGSMAGNSASAAPAAFKPAGAADIAQERALQQFGGARIYLDGSYSTAPLVTGVQVPLDTLDYDYIDMWDPTNPDVLTVPTGYDGFWLVIGHVTYSTPDPSPGALGTRFARTDSSADGKIASLSSAPTASDIGLNFSVEAVGTVFANAGDEFSLTQKQTSAVNVNVIGEDRGTTWLSATFLGAASSV